MQPSSSPDLQYVHHSKYLTNTLQDALFVEVSHLCQQCKDVNTRANSCSMITTYKSESCQNSPVPWENAPSWNSLLSHMTVEPSTICTGIMWLSYLTWNLFRWQKQEKSWWIMCESLMVYGKIKVYLMEMCKFSPLIKLSHFT